MTISMEQVRDTLRKDDHGYINAQINRLMDTAKAALFAEIGYVDNVTVIPEGREADFDNLSDSYIIEYVRAHLDQVDNTVVRIAIATQLEAILKTPSQAGL